MSWEAEIRSDVWDLPWNSIWWRVDLENSLNSSFTNQLQKQAQETHNRISRISKLPPQGARSNKNHDPISKLLPSFLENKGKKKNSRQIPNNIVDKGMCNESLIALEAQAPYDQRS